jgi:hypothetical protein
MAIGTLAPAPSGSREPEAGAAVTIRIVALGALLGLLLATVGPERGTDRRTERRGAFRDRTGHLPLG